MTPSNTFRAAAALVSVCTTFVLFSAVASLGGQARTTADVQVAMAQIQPQVVC
jgi:hypothetical protein